ncbi:MAG TPA: ABC transporter ATP-binding protein [Anaerolineae bacterium]|nr:ABC transporter ATP-binding protein [Anaerolineae bacterium]
MNQEFRIDNAYTYNRSSPSRWILSHLGRYYWLPLIMLVSSLLNRFGFTYAQFLIGDAFDLITTPNWQRPELIRITLAILAAATLQGVLGLARNYANEFLAQRIERDARDELYTNLLGKSQSFHGRQRIGDIMARTTNDVRALNIMFSPGVMLILDAIMGIIIPFLLIASLNIQLLLTPILFLLFFIITLRYYANQLGPVSLALREQFGLTNAILAEAIAGIEVVKGNAQEEQEIEAFTTNAALYRDHFIEQGKIQARYLPLLVFGLGLGLGFCHALILWQNGTLSLGNVISFMAVFGTLRVPTFLSLFSFNLVQLGLASAQRILELINTENDLGAQETGHDAPINGAVTFKNVSFSYQDNPVLKNISFAIQPGQVVAIVGQTGAGKTTLTRLINRIFDADEGQILIDGVDVRDWQLTALRSQISTIEQDIFLFSRSLAENIAFGQNDATMAQIEQAAREAQAHDFIQTFTHGYQTEIGERGVTLSGGQRQRIAIARAFLTNPRILILDDSTSAIDSATEDKIQQAMQRISQHRTTFLITHRLSQIRWADHILVLANGQLVGHGTHEHLLATNDDYRRIFTRYD